MPPIQVELFSAPNCRRCGKAKILLEAVVSLWPESEICWRVVDVVEELDHAVQIGVLATPAIAVDGQLVFTAIPAEERLRDVLRQHVEQARTIPE